MSKKFGSRDCQFERGKNRPAKFGDEVFDNLLFASGAERSKKRPFLNEIEPRSVVECAQSHRFEGWLHVLLGFLGDTVDFFKRRNSSEYL